VSGLDKINNEDVLNSNEYISILNRIKNLDTKTIDFALNIAEDLRSNQNNTIILKKIIDQLGEKEA
jgi:hypothetical protein